MHGEARRGHAERAQPTTRRGGSAGSAGSPPPAARPCRGRARLRSRREGGRRGGRSPAWAPTSSLGGFLPRPPCWQPCALTGAAGKQTPGRLPPSSATCPWPPVLIPHPLIPPRPAGPPTLVRVVLRLEEPGQHVLRAPARHAPAVVVGRGAAVVERGVGAGAAAQQLAARLRGIQRVEAAGAAAGAAS